MRTVTVSISTSLDGYIADANGGIDWSVPDDDLFRTYLDELRTTDVHLLGRRLYETMRYWETHEQDPQLSTDEREWARLWNALPKVVFSTTLTSVHGDARLLSGAVAEELRRLKSAAGDGEIAVGGAVLAAEAAAADLIDEYRVSVHPVLVGGGTPLFPRDERRTRLTLIDSRVYDSGVVRSRYRVVR